jgi:hypothetical protein
MDMDKMVSDAQDKIAVSIDASVKEHLAEMKALAEAAKKRLGVETPLEKQCGCSGCGCKK